MDDVGRYRVLKTARGGDIVGVFSGGVLPVLMALIIGVVSGCQMIGGTPVPESDGDERIIAVEFEALPDLQDLLRPVYPDEPLESTLQERFSLSHALAGLGQIRVTGSEALEEVDADGEVRMGFDNWTAAVEGALIRQDYEMKALQLELARYQYQAGDIEAAALQAYDEAFAQALSDFLDFWGTFSVAD